MFISLVAFRNLTLHQLDIKNSFQQSDLQEKVYMKQPSDFFSLEENRNVYHLKKFVYSLKKSQHAWFQKFSEVV